MYEIRLKKLKELKNKLQKQYKIGQNCHDWDSDTCPLCLQFDKNGENTCRNCPFNYFAAYGTRPGCVAFGNIDYSPGKMLRFIYIVIPDLVSLLMDMIDGYERLQGKRR